MHWYKIHADDGDGGTRSWVGTSESSPAELARSIEDGRMVRLADVLYVNRGELKEWTDSNEGAERAIFINPLRIVWFAEFRGDPRAEHRH